MTFKLNCWSQFIFSAEVMHDRPAPIFQPLDVKAKHKVSAQHCVLHDVVIFLAMQCYLNLKSFAKSSSTSVCFCLTNFATNDSIIHFFLG